MPDPTVTNLEIPATIEERKTKALEDQAAAMLRTAASSEKHVTLMQEMSGTLPDGPGPRELRFERLLHSCLQGRVAAVQSVEGYLAFARELCDGMEREFPPAPAP